MDTIGALVLFAILNYVNTDRVDFRNYQVLKITTKSKDDFNVLRNLDGSGENVIFLSGVQKESHVVVAPEKIEEIVQILDKHGIQHKTVETDFQRIINENEDQSESRTAEEYNWKSYQTLEKTYEWLQSLQEKYPDKIELLKGGRTYEGRDILGVKLSYKPGNKGVFIEGGIHAREWISPATVTFILNQLLTSEESSVREMAESFDWYIFPHFNPDAYVHTHTTNRLWRKTRSKQSDDCYGVDPNRNWGFHWDEAGTSHESCSEVYSGRSAFSEIETRTMSEFISSLEGKLHTYLAFHSFSQLMLFPYGHTEEHAKNYDDLQEIGKEAAKALEKRYGTKYKVGSTYEAIYPAAGGSSDWAYGSQNISISYTYELRPSGGFSGFILPKEQIIPTGEETLDSLLALFGKALKLGYYQ